MEPQNFPIENFNQNVVNLYVSIINKTWCLLTKKNYHVYKRAMAIKAVHGKIKVTQ
ncbi:MAG: hypothetical protein IPO21_03860 [Bacteroidales bacterium]|nr:hypothetical protein [Bacteroidales bacterium]